MCHRIIIPSGLDIIIPSGLDRTDANCCAGAQSGKSAESRRLPRRSRGLQGLARATTLQSMGAVDRGAPEWRTADAGEFRRTSLPVRESPLCGKVPAPELG